MGTKPRGKYSTDFNINQGKIWSNKEPDKYLPYFCVYDKDFENFGSTKAVYVLRKKNIKELEELCQEMWVKEVSNSPRPNTKLGLSDWLNETTPDKIIELLEEHLGDRIDVVTERKLKIKDIVIVYPHKPRKRRFF